MGKTDLFRILRRAAHKAMAATRLGVGPDELAARAAAARAARPGPSRRDLLRGLGVAGAGLALAPLAGCGDDLAVPGPRVAIVGGGVAGVNAAYVLRQHGIAATIYEASGRTGGRMFTGHGMFPNGQVVELGGELVDTSHDMIQAYAMQFGLGLDDLHAEEMQLGLSSDTFFFDGAVVPEATIVADFMPVAQKMSDAIAATAASAAEFTRVDNLSIPEWLAQEAGLAPSALIRRLLELAYLGEYGLEVAQQSSFNLLNLIDWANPDPFHVFGNSDERYHVHMGSQSVPDALAGTLDPSQIVLDHKLVALAALRGGHFRLSFDTSGGAVDVIADHVILALPFTMLRAVELGASGLPADKLNIIATLGYGTNAKLMTAYATRVWRDHGSAGTSIVDVGQLQATWDTSRGQAGPTGLLVDFVGGDRGVAIGAGSAEERAAEIVPWVDTVFPGAKAAYMAGSAVRQHWPTQPFTLGSYACYKPGQTSFSGMEGARVGKIHFCGEHCSQDYQGYMEGGAETGAMAAGEILDDLGIAHGAQLTALLARKLALPQGSYHASGGARLYGPARWLRRRRG